MREGVGWREKRRVGGMVAGRGFGSAVPEAIKTAALPVGNGP